MTSEARDTAVAALRDEYPGIFYWEDPRWDDKPLGEVLATEAPGATPSEPPDHADDCEVRYHGWQGPCTCGVDAATPQASAPTWEPRVDDGAVHALSADHVDALLGRAEPGEALRLALGELLDDYLATNGPDGYPQPMPEAWRVVRRWLASTPSAPPEALRLALAAVMRVNHGPVVVGVLDFEGEGLRECACAVHEDARRLLAAIPDVAAPFAYPGPHDDCIATVPHYHDRAYQHGDWSAGAEPGEALRLALLNLVNAIDEDWQPLWKHEVLDEARRALAATPDGGDT